ncbi:MAG TPA: RNA 2',3'-cyclic phosphodiesterase [Verrucomicrobiae bacterium]|nr:RNA 2',3'-cyclic phosphodiesterase [Verrucomicrobiae bacterium]
MAEDQQLFFALWPKPPLARRITDAASRVAGQRKLVGTAVPPERAHLTLLFVGAVPEAQFAKLWAAAAKVSVPSFELVIDQVGCFYRSRAFWAGPTQVPEPLAELAGQLRAAVASAGLPPDAKAFVPHVTCLRDVSDRIRPVPIEPIRWAVREFALVRSPEYHVVSHWPLQNARE